MGWGKIEKDQPARARERKQNGGTESACREGRKSIEELKNPLFEGRSDTEKRKPVLELEETPITTGEHRGSYLFRIERDEQQRKKTPRGMPS